MTKKIKAFDYNNQEIHIGDVVSHADNNSYHGIVLDFDREASVALGEGREIVDVFWFATNDSYPYWSRSLIILEKTEC